MTSLKQGDFGFDVFMLQIRLDLWPSFYFDERTTKAVMAFQKANKLKVDGEVGRITRTTLNLRPAIASVSNDASVSIDLNKPWLALALREKGIVENPSKTLHNPRIVEYHKTTKFKPTTDEIAWCSSFVNFIMKESGYEGTGDALAKSWLEWAHGVLVSSGAQEQGDIVIVRTVVAEEAEKKEKDTGKKKKLSFLGYHVGFYMASPPGRVTIFGGNQGPDGDGKVKESNYLLTSYVVKGYRRPIGSGHSIFMKFGNTVGSATEKGHEGWTKIDSFNFSTERNISMESGKLANREYSKPHVGRIAITKYLDKSSPALFQASLKGGAVDVTIVFVNTKHEYMTIKLRHVIISNYTPRAQANGTAMEGITLSYSKVEVACTGQDASGKACGPQRVAYDVGAARLA